VRYFTLVKDTALTVVPGLIGAYANAFFRLEQSELPEFVGAIASLRQCGQISESVRQEAGPPDAGFPDYKAGLRPAELKHLICEIS